MGHSKVKASLNPFERNSSKPTYDYLRCHSSGSGEHQFSEEKFCKEVISLYNCAANFQSERVVAGSGVILHLDVKILIFNNKNSNLEMVYGIL